jgi:AcrR family transcriptional regulator
MSDVASAAGVSRQTLYNEFGSRSALVEAYVGREIDRLVERTTAAVRRNADDAHRALHEAFRLFLELASDEPVVRIIVDDGDAGELHRLLPGLGQALARDRVAQLITDVWPQVADLDAQLLAETLVRLAISHALLPTAEPEDVAAGVSRMLASFVDGLLAG